MEILSYEEFKEEVKKYAKECLTKEEYQNYEVQFGTSIKVNTELDSFSLFERSYQKTSLRPLLYLNHLYEDYKLSLSVQEVVDKAMKTMVTSLNENQEKYIGKDGKFLDLNLLKDRIIMALINTKQNQQICSICPHREFLDLSIIYRFFICEDDRGCSFITVNNQIAEDIKLNEEELYQLALNNTKILMRPKVQSMSKFLRNLFCGVDVNLDDLPELNSENDGMMWVITNEKRIGGAVSMVFTDVIHEISERTNSNLYILPSSIHELIAVPESKEDDIEQFSQMVVEINQTDVNETERLSNQVYYYDRLKKQISILTNNDTHLI